MFNKFSAWVAERLRLPGAPTTMEQASGKGRFETHERTIDRRPGFRQLVTDTQTDLLATIDRLTNSCQARLILEIGSGVIPLRDLSGDALATDIEHGPGVDCLVSATDIPFRDNSLRALVGQNVFHHIPDQQRALREMARVVEPGGIIVLLEPYHGWLARRIYPALFSFEGYDLTVPLGVSTTDASGAVIPNQGSSYIVFDRERSKFEREFAELEITSTQALPSGLRYLATGGLNFRQLTPAFVLRFLRWLEHTRRGGRALSSMALHWVVVLRVAS